MKYNFNMLDYQDSTTESSTFNDFGKRQLVFHQNFEHEIEQDTILTLDTLKDPLTIQY